MTSTGAYSFENAMVILYGSPESDYNLPDVYRNKGVSVGDLGILTDDGGFDFLFNVCAEADDPVNQGRVPAQFQPLRIHVAQAMPYEKYLIIVEIPLSRVLKCQRRNSQLKVQHR